MGKTLITVLAVLTFIVINSCGQKQDITGQEKADLQTAPLLLAMPTNSIPAPVLSITGTLTRPNYDSISAKFIVRDDTAYLDFGQIYAGTWHLAVSAYDSTESLLYFGETDVNVMAGRQNTVFLQLNPVTGNLEVIVTWGDNTPKLVAYYPFDGSAADFSGNGNHGSVFGAVPAEDMYGHPNRAYFFDGIDDYITIRNKSILRPDFPISVAACINFPPDASAPPIFLNNFTENCYTGITFFVSSERNLCLTIGNGGPIRIDSRRTEIGSTILQPNTWYHVAAVARNMNDIRLYVNGMEEASRSEGYGQQLYYNPAGPGTIAVSDSNGTPGSLHYYKGRIDELYFYHSALSAAEIDSLLELPQP
ncbi:MAG: LamG domain-containing protein [Calditrichia bacterium]